MPKFQYTAKALDGSIKKNIAEVADVARLKERLRGEGLFLISCKELKSSNVTTKIKAVELSDFCRQVGTMLASGVSLLRTVEIISERDIKPNLRKVYQNLVRSLQRGVPLWESMEMEGNAFPKLLINMIAAGEASGKLDQTAMKMAYHYEKEHRLKTKIRNAATYPIILLIITVVVMIVIFTFVLPNFFTMFEGTTLPVPTRIVMGISNGIIAHWPLILIILSLLIAGIAFLRSLPKVRLQLDKTKLSLPLVGKLLRTIYTARFARTLSSLYASGLTMMDALTVSSGTVGNVYIMSQFDELLAKVRQGASLSESIGQVDGFDRKLASTIMIGEETGRLDDMLEAVANTFDYEADMATQKLTTILEPLLIVIMAVLVAFVMISVMLPIYDMYNSIG